MRHVLCAMVAAGLLGLPFGAAASPYPLEEILDKAAAQTLAKENIRTTDDLLQQGATLKQRKALAKTTALPLPKLDAWTKLSDLVRIKGVGPEMVRLLGAGKVKTVKDLQGQAAAKLHKALIAANTRTKITQKPPSEDQVANWIEQAKKLKIVLR